MSFPLYDPYKALRGEAPESTLFNCLSLGAGVQSSTLALMAARGEIDPAPDFAIFADTQREPGKIYEWLSWLVAEIGRSPRPFPVHVVSKGDLGAQALRIRTGPTGERYFPTDVPFFVIEPGRPVRFAKVRRCTSHFKIRQVHRTMRRLAGVRYGTKEPVVTQWIGISRDEIQRMTDRREPWFQNRWPLVELGMDRRKCLEWWQGKGLPLPPRSACYFCAFRSADEWRDLQIQEPASFQAAVDFELNLQAVYREVGRGGGLPFLTKWGRPLSEGFFPTGAKDLLPGFGLGDECLGACGH